MIKYLSAIAAFVLMWATFYLSGHPFIRGEELAAWFLASLCLSVFGWCLGALIELERP